MICWCRIDRLPQKEAEKLSENEAVKLITLSPYFVEHATTGSSDPLGIPLGETVCAETSE